MNYFSSKNKTSSHVFREQFPRIVTVQIISATKDPIRTWNVRTLQEAEC